MPSVRAPEFEESVFINCPFDRRYQGLFRAIVFTIHDCGFIARCSLEISDASQIRATKILKIISECRLGVHDISRTQLDSATRLPRFNMPLELGMFLAAKEFGSGKQKTKSCLIIDDERYRFQRFISDIAGQDISAHHRQVDTVISVTRDFLRLARPAVMVPGGKLIFKRYSNFLKQIPSICRTAGLEPAKLIFNDYATLVSEWLKNHP